MALPLTAGTRAVRTPVIYLQRIFLILYGIFAALFLTLPLRNPIELWDESRYANNAVEITMRGHWLTPTYGWVVDHWNTKPPLLVSIIAGLERLGAPAIVALRLPSEIGCLGCAGLIYLFCLKVLKRPFVACAAAMMFMSATIVFGPHVAVNGDCDGLLCLFTTVVTLGFFAFVEPLDSLDTAGITLAAVFLTLAVLLKGIAGLLFLPGLLLYALARGRLAAILRDRRLWWALLSAVAVIVLSYLGRNHIDPGYLAAVWNNELFGRYAQANEGHHARALYYAHYLVQHFVPGIFLFPLGFFTLLRGPRRLPWQDRSVPYGVSVMCAVVSLTFLLLLAKAKTKIFYYCVPAVPLMSIFAAMGLDDVLARFAERNPDVRKGVLNHFRLEAISFVALAIVLCWTTRQALLGSRANTSGDEAFYGQALADMQQHGIRGPILMIEPGFTTNANFKHYHPSADYYAKEATRQGMAVTVLNAMPDTEPASTPGAWLLSCNASLAHALEADPSLRSKVSPNPTCTYAHAAL